jgi:hypothetical protein
MTIQLVEETAATGLDTVHIREDSAATGMSRQTAELLMKSARPGPGPLVAAFVLSAALTSGAAMGIAPVVMNTGRRDEISAESSTTLPEYDSELLDQISDLFERGASEFFHDGVQSAFSKGLLTIVAHRGRAALHAIADYLFSGERNPDVASEALRWLADFNDRATLAQRWSILQRTVRHRSARVRDGAILGFAALDDPRARPLLVEARNVEQIAELRRLIDNVLQQLDATTHAHISSNRPGEPLV